MVFLIGIVGFIVGFACLFMGLLSVEKSGLIAMGSFLEILLVWSIYRHSKPISPITGVPLDQYLSTNPTPRDIEDTGSYPIVEMVYVDHQSRKFFTHVWVENDSIGE